MSRLHSRLARRRTLHLSDAFLLSIAATLAMAAEPPKADTPRAATLPSSAPNAAPSANTPPDVSPSPIDTLDQSALQETFRLLRTNYIQRDSLTLEMLNRAALGGLLQRLDFGAELVPITPLSTTPSPTTAATGAQPPDTSGDRGVAAAAATRWVVAERLAGGAFYIRPTAFTLEMIDALDEALATAEAPAESTVVLDLRTPAPPADFAVAARLLERFVPAAQPLFSVQKPDDQAPRQFRSTGTPRWTGRLIVLIDDHSGNVAETVAAVLRGVMKVPLVGGPTPGRTMQYETARISPTHALRFASAEMRLPDGTSLFRKGLQPDLAVPVNAAAKTSVFERQPTEGVAPFITHTERPRHNEAALVAGTAPEIPYHVARGAGKTTPFDTPPLQDRTLQTVVDLLVTRKALR